MKNLKKLELQEDPFTLGKVIPSIVEFTQSNNKNEEEKENEEPEEEEPEEKDDEEPEEEEPEEEEEKDIPPTNAELVEEIMELSVNDHNSVYFHETQDEKNIIFWSIKSSNHFTEL